MPYSADEKNEERSEQRIDRPDRRAGGDRRCENRKSYTDGEYRDSIPRRMSDFEGIILDD